MSEIATKEEEFKDLIHAIRGQQVILDHDLAKLYGTEVSKLNQQVKRNIEKFPEDFMFQLTKEEQENLKSQNVTSRTHGGKRKLSFVFTEQGVYMVATILKNDIATKQSIYIMRSFKAMKHYIAENKLLLSNNELVNIKSRLDEHDVMITTIMDDFLSKEMKREQLFLNGQVFDATDAYIKIYKQAKMNIYIIDDYIDIDTLSLLRYRRDGVNITIFSGNKGVKKLTKSEVKKFNIQYPSLSMKYTDSVHDRFIVIDYGTNNERFYVCGTSSKDAGKKICTIVQLYDKNILHILINALSDSPSYNF